MQRKEDNRFPKGAIIVAKDERTDIAKAEDNPCPFKEAIDKNVVFQPRQEQSNSFSIVQSAKDVGYSIGWAYRRAIRLVQHGVDSKSVRFQNNVMLGTYDDHEVSGPLKSCTYRRQSYARGGTQDPWSTCTAVCVTRNPGLLNYFLSGVKSHLSLKPTGKHMNRWKIVYVDDTISKVVRSMLKNVSFTRDLCIWRAVIGRITPFEAQSAHLMFVYYFIVLC